MSMTTSHPTTTPHRWSSPAGLLMAAMAVCVIAAVAWAAYTVGTRTRQDAARDDRLGAASATLNHEIVAPAYSARFDDAVVLEAAAWRRYAAGEFAAAWRNYADALATLTPETVASQPAVSGLVAGAVGQIGQPGVAVPAIDLRGQPAQHLTGLVEGAVGRLAQG
jgi:hypothetical protein